MSLADYQRRFCRLNVNVSGGRRSPHKICMLLAVLDLARGGCLVANEVRYDPVLLVRYNRYFAAVQAPRNVSRRMRQWGEKFSVQTLS